MTYKIRTTHKRPVVELAASCASLLLDPALKDEARVARLYESDREEELSDRIFVTRRELVSMISDGTYQEGTAFHDVISQRGGVTEVTLVDPTDGHPLASGVAYCRLDEQFNKKLGRTIALNRALKQLEAVE